MGETAADTRDVMVEGESGLLAIHPKDFRPQYEPSKRRVTWPNGARATLYNAVEPDQLRGPQHDCAWCDELAKWRYAQETWDMLQFGLRLGTNPRQVISTTPRPIATLKQILNDAGTIVTRGRTEENASNLALTFLHTIKARYEGTRLGRQELNAEILEDAPDALWTRANLDEDRRPQLHRPVPLMKRVVVGVDPAAKANEIPEEGAATGIIVCGLGEDGRGYVLDDATTRGSPNTWARMVCAMVDKHSADCVVAEVNQGGDMVESTIRTVRPNLRIRKVVSTKGKWLRAEPIAAIYEQHRVSHVGIFPALEDEMVAFTPNGLVDGRSPDHVDALVHGMTELFPEMTKRVMGFAGPPRVENCSTYNPLARH